MSLQAVSVALGCPVSQSTRNKTDSHGSLVVSPGSSLRTEASSQREGTAAELWQEFQQRCRLPTAMIEGDELKDALAILREDGGLARTTVVWRHDKGSARERLPLIRSCARLGLSDIVSVLLVHNVDAVLREEVVLDAIRNDRSTPVRAIQALDDNCSTLVYAQEGLFYFAAALGNGDDDEPGGVGSGGGGGGSVNASLPVHSGNVADFQVNPFSRDIVSGGDDGHVHVLNFPPDMAGVPTMKASKYVGSELSSVRWGLGQPYIASWTTSAGHLQMLDTRDYRLVSSVYVDGPLPVYTHEHISDVVLAVGCEAGIVQLFDVRNMSSFLKVQDPVAGSIQQILPAVSEPSPGGSGVGDWMAFGAGGVSRYTVNATTNGSTIGPGAVGSSDGDMMTRIASGLSYSAGCRTIDLELTADLDINAGLFLAPPQPGQAGGLLCGITLDARIVTFSSGLASKGTPGIAGRVSSAAPLDGTKVREGGSRGGGVGSGTA